MLEEVRFIRSNCPFLAEHQKSSHEKNSTNHRNSRGKDVLFTSHEQKLPVAPGNGSDPVRVTVAECWVTGARMETPGKHPTASDGFLLEIGI